MNNYLFISLLSLTLVVTNATAAKQMSEAAKRLMLQAQKEIKPITPKEFHHLMDEDEIEFVQLDVRENNQYGHGEIWSMEKIKLTRGYVEYKAEYAIPDKNTKVVVVCCSGRRAVLAAKTMKSLGYTDVSYLQGGVNEWLLSGYPLDTVFGELYLKP
ncbi:MAG: rhodanese-like domain-containing protein [Campylobacterota bacterium]